MRRQASTLVMSGICVIVFGVAGRADEDEARIEVTAKSLVKTNGHYVEFTVTNKGKKPISFYWHNLPWGTRDYALKLHPVAEKNEIRIGGFPFADPPFLIIEIGAGKQKTGEIKLSDQFTNIEALLNRESIDLFWSYQADTIGGPQTNRCGGWVYLKKAKSDEK
jgi:hypothetical protein